MCCKIIFFLFDGLFGIFLVFLRPVKITGMKRIALYFSGAVLLCFVLSCARNENVPSEAEIREKIIGEWRSVSFDGVEELTDKRTVREFHEDGTSLASLTRYNEWMVKVNEVYAVDGNVVRVKRRSGHITEHSVKEITDDALVVSKFRYIDHPEFDYSGEEVYEKIENDYAGWIIGTWEGVEAQGDTTYGGAVNHRWEYWDNNVYVYYSYVNGKWVPSDNTYNEYSVDGNWLASRWQQKAGGEMFYEWWDIEQCDENQMIWTALRQREDGSRFRTKFIMKRVEWDKR